MGRTSRALRVRPVVLLGLLPGVWALGGCTGKPKDDPPTVYEGVPVNYEAAALREFEPKIKRPTIAATPSEPRVRDCVPNSLPTGALEFIRQQPLPMPDQFDPRGRFGATDGHLCEIWELDSGLYLGAFGEVRDSGVCVRWPGGKDPCVNWPDLEGLDFTPATRIRTTLEAKGIELIVEETLARALVDGVERYRFSHEDRPYLAVSLSPDETRIAAARADAIELREFETGALLAELSLTDPAPPGAELQRLALAWSGRMPVALLGREPSCGPEVDEEQCEFSGWADDDQPVWELRRWASPRAKVEAELVTWEDELTPAWIEEASIDPLGRWLFPVIGWGAGHDIEWEQRQIPLTAAAANSEVDLYEHGIDGERAERYGGLWGLGDRTDVQASSWVVGPRTARAWMFVRDEYDGEGNGSEDLAWASMQLWPSPRFSGPHPLASDYSVEEQALELFGVAEDEAVLAWSHCWTETDRHDLMELVGRDDIGEDMCRGHSPVPVGCEARGVSDRLDWLLVACAGAWRLIPLGPAAAALEPVELASANDGSVTASFGRSGLAIASERRGLALLSAAGQRRAAAAKVVELVPATLGPELDRVVGRRRSGVELELFDLANGALLHSIPAVFDPASAITRLAFAPDGRRLALTDGRQVAIYDLDGNAVTARWDAGVVVGLAWRQDGAVLFTGSELDRPDRAWDPAGVPAQDQDSVLARLRTADLDPSWRWAFDGDDVIIRALDGLALYLEGEGRVVTETGLYDHGATGPGGLFVRVVGLPHPGVVWLGSLPDRLHHPGLLADFLAGEALSRPLLSKDELAAKLAASGRE